MTVNDGRAFRRSARGRRIRTLHHPEREAAVINARNCPAAQIGEGVGWPPFEPLDDDGVLGVSGHHLTPPQSIREDEIADMNVDDTVRRSARAYALDGDLGGDADALESLLSLEDVELARDDPRLRDLVLDLDDPGGDERRQAVGEVGFLFLRRRRAVVIGIEEISRLRLPLQT